jgi:D-3-phosphoglycerate dehydrogenase
MISLVKIQRKKILNNKKGYIMKIFLMENIHNVGLELLKAKGYDDVTSLKNSPDESELLEIVRKADAVIIRSRTKLTEKVLAEAKNLKVIGCACVGTDQVNLPYSRNLGIPVFNSPYGNTRSVAELVIGEIIMLARKVPEKNEKCHNEIWDKSLTGCFEVKNKTIGIVGYGHIGTQVGVLAEALSMNVIYYDVVKKLNYGSAKVTNNLEELLKVADIVTMHVPNLPETENMMGKKEFSTMKKGAIFLNLSRGSVVDIEALHEALESGHLGGAGIDVFKVEPKNANDKFITELQKFSNVILTPHIGGLTEEAQINMALDAAEKIINFLENGSTSGAVNFPEINAGDNKNICRILHIHKNVPGVMGGINRIFADHGINIDTQFLQTKDDVGYAVIDIKNGDISDEMLEKIRKVENTIKVTKTYHR